MEFPTPRCDCAVGRSARPSVITEHRIHLSFLAPDGFDRKESYKRGAVQRRGHEILSSGESFNDESDRISLCQVFRDLVMFRIKVAPLNCPILLCRIAVLIKHVPYKLLCEDSPSQ